MRATRRKEHLQIIVTRPCAVAASPSWGSATSRRTRSATADVTCDSTHARARVDELIAEGADIVDIGGESTRPGREPCSRDEQLARVLAVVRYAAERGACVSIDTTDAARRRACLDAGAHAVNDVSLPRANPDLASVAAGSGAALILSHARAPQAKMTGFGGVAADGAYDDVVADVLADWERAAARAVASSALPRDALVMDPGLGFSKTARHIVRAPPSRPRARRSRRPARPGARAARAASRSSPWSTRRRGVPRSRDRRVDRRGARRALRARHRARARRARHARRSTSTSAATHAEATLRDRVRKRGGDLMLEGLRHLFSARARWLRSSSTSSTSSSSRTSSTARCSSCAARARCRWASASAIVFLVYLGAKLLELRHAAQPALVAALVDRPHRRRRLPERHPPRRSCASAARAFFGGMARAAGVARHRRGRRRRDRARAPPHGRAHRVRAGRERRRVRRRARASSSTRGHARAPRLALRAGVA